MSGCWHDGLKPTPTMPQLSSWALATDRSELRSWLWPIGNFASTPRSRRLLTKALRKVQQVPPLEENAA